MIWTSPTLRRGSCTRVRKFLSLFSHLPTHAVRVHNALLDACPGSLRFPGTSMHVRTKFYPT